MSTSPETRVEQAALVQFLTAQAEAERLGGDNVRASMFTQAAQVVAKSSTTEAQADELMSKTMITELALRDGGLYAGIEGGAAGLLAAGFAEQFTKSGGVNYVQVSFTHPSTGPMIVTLQRVEGKTPHQLRQEAESDAKNLRGLLRRAQGYIMAWAKQYGENDPEWLPPAGGAELLEDISEQLPTEAIKT